MLAREGWRGGEGGLPVNMRAMSRQKAVTSRPHAITNTIPDIL